MNDYIEVGGRCRGALFLRRHRCIYTKGLGYRCKYCDTPLYRLRQQERKKKR